MAVYETDHDHIVGGPHDCGLKRGEIVCGPHYDNVVPYYVDYNGDVFYSEEG